MDADRSQLLAQFEGKYGLVLWRGLSLYDQTPIMAVLTHVRRPTLNRELGDCAQIAILPYEAPPVEAQRDGRDVSVCGSCPQRPSQGGGCYVSAAHGPQRTWFAARGLGEGTLSREYPPATDWRVLGLKRLRIGSWGDPAAVPIPVWDSVRWFARRGFLAYTHGWHLDRCQTMRTWCMASVDSPDEQRRATSMGWRTFRTRTSSSPLLPGERMCPKAAESPTHGRVTCRMCGQCDGTGRGARRPNYAIFVHGMRRRRAGFVVSPHSKES